jgi:hypothetical protein
MIIPNRDTPEYEAWVRHIVEENRKADETSIDDMCNMLEKFGSGAHIHDANKARHYLQFFAGIPEDHYPSVRKPFGPSYDRVKELKRVIWFAIYENEWGHLKDQMAGWF